MRRLSTFLLMLLTFSLVGCDHLTKQIAVDSFQETPRVFLSGFLKFTYTENRDMAFGLLSSIMGDEARLWLLTTIKLVSVLVGVFIWLRRRKVLSLAEGVALSLVMSGALGNLIDRVMRGYVVDFVQLPYWPVFNVADMTIVAGLGLFVVESSRQKELVPAPDFSLKS